MSRRRADQAMPNLWEFPGGKVEPGEHPEAALVREVREELGCGIAVDGIHEVVFHAYPDFDLYMLVYASRITAGDAARRRGRGDGVGRRRRSSPSWISARGLPARPRARRRRGQPQAAVDGLRRRLEALGRGRLGRRGARRWRGASADDAAAASQPGRRMRVAAAPRAPRRAPPPSRRACTRRTSPARPRRPGGSAAGSRAASRSASRTACRGSPASSCP